MTLESTLPRVLTFTAGLVLGGSLMTATVPTPVVVGQDQDAAAAAGRAQAQDEGAAPDDGLTNVQRMAAELQQERHVEWTAFERHLYGEHGRAGLIENVRGRILELADLGDPESENFDDQMFFLGFMRLFQEMGTVIPGRNKGVQTSGPLEIMTESFEGDAWVLDAPLVKRVRGNPFEHLGSEDLTIPKGRFVRFIDRNGLHGPDTDPDTLEDTYVILVGLGEQAALIYPNERRPDDPWVAWLPGRTVEKTWTRPHIPESAGHPRGKMGRQVDGSGAR